MKTSSSDFGAGERSPTLVVIGDSHSTFWNGHNHTRETDRPAYSGVRVRHVGPVTAYNSLKTLADTALVARTVEDDPSIIVLSFGEIDCRAHIVKQAILRGIGIDAAVKAVVTRYQDTIDAYAETFRRPVIVWGPPPSSPPAHFHMNVDFPAIGTVLERNYATSLFTGYLAQRYADSAEVKVVSIFDELVTIAGDTRPGFLFDGCHLSQEAMPLALPRVIGAGLALGVKHVSEAFRRQWPITGDLKAVDASRTAILTHSGSALGKLKPKSGSVWSKRKGFVGDAGDQSWALFDLRAGVFIDAIVVSSKGGAPADGVVAETSMDGKMWEAFPLPSPPVETGAAPRLARYVRLTPSKGRSLAFSDVAIMSRTYET